MSLRFFTDQCVPNSVTQALRDAGHDVFILKEHIPQDSNDAVVIAKAQELDAILVSLNGDFADIATYPPSQYLFPQKVIRDRKRGNERVGKGVGE